MKAIHPAGTGGFAVQRCLPQWLQLDPRQNPEPAELQQ
jgi:hypothetical protein